jgi:hypothetical protein
MCKKMVLVCLTLMSCVVGSCQGTDVTVFSSQTPTSQSTEESIRTVVPKEAMSPTPPSTSSTPHIQSATPSITEVFNYSTFPIVEATGCIWDEPSEVTPFRFGGKILLAEFVPRSTNDLPEKYNLWEISFETGVPRFINSYELFTYPPSGPPNFLSPDGQWMLTVSTWNPRLDIDPPPPPPIQLTTSDGSQSFLVEWDPAWDMTLGWWDNESIVILPSNGKTTDIMLLNVFTQELIPHPAVQNAINRSFGTTFWSPWRYRAGEVVFFNHQLSQVLYFEDNSGAIELSNLEEDIPLWSFYFQGAFDYVAGLATWSPDDQYVAFPVRFGQVDELFVVSSKGEALQLSHFSDIANGRFGVDILGNTSWSRDSTRLALLTFSFSSENERVLKIFILDLANEEIHDMCTIGSPVTFSPDGRFLLYYPGSQDQVDSNIPISVLDVQTGEKWLLDSSHIWYVVGWLPD